MKKWLLWSLLPLLLVIIFFGYKQLSTQEIRPKADYYIYSLTEMEELATVIVEANWEKATDSIVKLDEKDKFPLDTRTFSNIRINKVFKGDSLVKEGEKLNVLEYYAKWRDWAGSYEKLPDELYKPLRAGKKYLLFLYLSPEESTGSFEIIGNYQGKYLFPSNSSKNNTPSLDELDIAENDEHYNSLYTQVSEKYFSSDDK